MCTSWSPNCNDANIGVVHSSSSRTSNTSQCTRRAQAADPTPARNVLLMRCCYALALLVTVDEGKLASFLFVAISAPRTGSAYFGAAVPFRGQNKHGRFFLYGECRSKMHLEYEAHRWTGCRWSRSFNMVLTITSYLVVGITRC